ncbi:MAG: DUF2851 family protein [Cytophagaceae bacterium]|nr:DUF2851 family protein [Cytophagaceae bacterium]
MIKENFLHFIWKLQYFNKENLQTTQGEKIHIFFPGTLNKDAGPDFSNARVKIGDVEWAGNIEVHINSSEWHLHNHHHDGAYNNVILHVTWKDDDPVRRDDDSLIPTLELHSRVSESLILKYSSIVNASEEIPCSAHLEKISSIHKISMMEKVLVERLHSRSHFILDLYRKTNNDWQETAYQLLAKNFGFKLNADPFLRLAQNVPLKILLKHRQNPSQLEAILFGQAGLLEENSKEQYVKNLYREYSFLAQKFSLSQNQLSKSEWKFLRIRPANFPTIRIAEFVCLISLHSNFFTSILEFSSVKQVKECLSEIEVSSYWKEHYTFGNKSTLIKNKGLGEDSIENIIINSIAPFLFVYGKERKENEYVFRAMHLLENISPEKNKIISLWKKSGMDIDNALQSQGAIELYNSYCLKKNCLSCEIGASILKERKESVV